MECGLAHLAQRIKAALARRDQGGGQSGYLEDRRPYTGVSAAMTGSGAVRDSKTDTGVRSLSNTSTYRSPSRRNGEQVGDFERSDHVATT